MAEFTSFTTQTHYRVYVTWVDHGTYVEDARVLPSLSNFSMETGRNFHVTGFRVDGVGDPIKYNIVIPQEIQGSFKLPQIGDVITVEERYRNLGESPVYVYSIYNDLNSENFVSSKIPPWGSIPGDYGHMRSHSDHNFQFSQQANADFTKKFIKSVTGYRFRKFYGHVFNTQNRFLEQGKFVVRGDSFFDVSKNDPMMSFVEINTEEGMDIIPVEGNSLSSEQNDYPNPLNVPLIREKDERYTYTSPVVRFLSKQIEGDIYRGEGTDDVNEFKDERYRYVFKNKNYFSYQPIVDKKYFEYLESIEPDPQGTKPDPYERELPAAEEYQLSLRGNNKLLIQDHYGDGEQLLITLKNQYDAGFTLVHNAETGQVRIRDHLGQGVLLEANPEAPRIITWTTERQFIDMGSIRSYDSTSGETESFGEYVYIRNGSVYGKSDTTFGRITENEIKRDEVPQQEFALINSTSESSFGKLITGLGKRMSEGFKTIITEASGNGFYFRNNPDPKKTNQFITVFNTFDEQPEFTTRMYQEHLPDLNSKNVITDFYQKIKDSESELYQLARYDTENGSSVSEALTSATVDNVVEFKAVSHLSESGLSMYSYENLADKSESKTVYKNSYIGESEIQVVRRAEIGGTAEQTVLIDDFITENQIQTYSNTVLPSTRTTQRKSGKIVNIVDSNDVRIKSSQFKPEEILSSEIEQTVSGDEQIRRTLYDGENKANEIIQKLNDIKYTQYDDALKANEIVQTKNDITYTQFDGEDKVNEVKQSKISILSTQYDGPLTMNTIEQSKTAITSTQHTSGGASNNIIKQEENKIKIELIQSSVDVDIKGKNVLMKGNEKVTIEGATVDIKGSAVNIIQI